MSEGVGNNIFIPVNRPTSGGESQFLMLKKAQKSWWPGLLQIFGNFLSFFALILGGVPFSYWKSFVPLSSFDGWHLCICSLIIGSRTMYLDTGIVLKLAVLCPKILYSSATLESAVKLNTHSQPHLHSEAEEVKNKKTLPWTARNRPCMHCCGPLID